MKLIKTLAIVVGLGMAFQGFSQEPEKEFKPTFKWSGFANIWAGYVQRDTLDGHYGFAVRYMRFKASGNLAKNVKYAAQFAFDKGNPSLLDLEVAYEPMDYLKVKFGQFPVPGAKSGVMSSKIWSTSKLIFNDRTTITQNWGSNASLSGYRSGGVMLYGGFLEDKIRYYAMAAMPQAGPKYYFNPSVKSPVYENDENGVALFSRLEFVPMENMEVGVNFHSGKGTSVDTVATKRGSYTLYFLTRQERLYAMAEYISGTNSKEINGIQTSEFSYSGYLLEIAYKYTPKIEQALRYDNYVPIKDGADNNGYEAYNNLSLGLNYYPHKNIALMLNYVLRMETPRTGVEKIKNDLIYFQLRYLFAS